MRRTNSLALRQKNVISVVAQFRTCLWPCVGREGAGQEARQPPGERSQNLSKKSDRQLEAKPAHSALSRGRGLKQRRSGFLGLCRSPPPARVTEEAWLSLPAVRTGTSPPKPKQYERDTMCSVGASPSRADAYPSLTAISGAQKALSRGGIAPMTERIREFLRKRNDEGPCLVVDLDVVRDNYNAFAKALPDTRVFYAVKANPAPEVLTLLAKLGSCFDTASIAEIEMVLAAGATPDRISYGNTIKKERDVARAYALGVRLYAV